MDVHACIQESPSCHLLTRQPRVSGHLETQTSGRGEGRTIRNVGARSDIRQHGSFSCVAKCRRSICFARCLRGCCARPTADERSDAAVSDIAEGDDDERRPIKLADALAEYRDQSSRRNKASEKADQGEHTEDSHDFRSMHYPVGIDPDQLSPIEVMRISRIESEMVPTARSAFVLAETAILTPRHY